MLTAFHFHQVLMNFVQGTPSGYHGAFIRVSSNCVQVFAAFKQFYVTWQKICGDMNGSIICNYITMSRQAWIWCRCWETRLDTWAIMWLTCVTVRVLKSRTSRDLSCDSSIYAYRLSLLPISYLWHHDDVTMISYASYSHSISTTMFSLKNFYTLKPCLILFLQVEPR